MSRLPWLAAIPALFIAGPLVAQDEPKPDKAAEAKPAPKAGPIEVPDVVRGITARELGGHMKFLASDLMRGRDTASPEIRLAAEYLATRLSAAGADPAGDADQGGRPSYFQRFPLEVNTALLEGTGLTLEIDRDGSKRLIPLQLGTDVTFTPTGLTPGEIDAPVIFAGYGRSDPAEKVDDYEGLDVKNQFVLVLAGQPPAKPKEGTAEPEKAAEPAQAKGRQGGRGRQGMGGAYFAKLEPATRRGASGVFIARPAAAPAARHDPIPPAGRTLPGFGRPAMSLGSLTAAVPLFILADPIRDRLFKAAGLEADEPKPGALAGVRAKFTFAANKEMKEDRNVVGFFPALTPKGRRKS